MVYASILESRVVTRRWDDFQRVLIEMELDGMSLPAIPTDWLLRVVDRLLDAVHALIVLFGCVGVWTDGR